MRSADEQLGHMSQKALVQDLGLLDAPAQAIHGDALPCRQELRELVHLVAKRDTRRRLDAQPATTCGTIRNRRLTGPMVATNSSTHSSVATTEMRAATSIKV